MYMWVYNLKAIDEVKAHPLSYLTPQDVKSWIVNDEVSLPSMAGTNEDGIILLLVSGCWMIEKMEVLSALTTQVSFIESNKSSV